MPTQNLGQVSAIHIGSSAPSNTNLLWRDTSVTPNLWKQYNTQELSWKAAGGGNYTVVTEGGRALSVGWGYLLTSLSGSVDVFLPASSINGDNIEILVAYSNDNSIVEIYNYGNVPGEDSPFASFGTAETNTLYKITYYNGSWTLKRLDNEGNGGGAAERENTTKVVGGNAQTTTIDFSGVDVKTITFNNSITTHIIAVSNLSVTERYNTLIIDNSANSVGLTVTLNDQTGGVTYRGAKNDFPGLYPNINIAANSVWNISFENRSATLTEISFDEVEDYA